MMSGRGGGTGREQARVFGYIREACGLLSRLQCSPVSLSVLKSVYTPSNCVKRSQCPPVCSIFMASTTTSGSPSCTDWLELTNTCGWGTADA